MSQAEHRQGLHELLADLPGDETIVPEAVRGILDRVPGYDGVGLDSLEKSVRRNLDLSIRVVQGRRAPVETEIPEAEELAIERLAQGVALGTVNAGFRECMSVILRRLLALAPQYGVSAAEALSCSTSLWALGDAFSARALRVYQDAAITAAVADSARKMQWLVEAVVRGMPPADLRRGATAYGVPIDRPLRAVSIVLPPDDGNGGGPSAEELITSADTGAARLVTAPHAPGAIGILWGDLEDSPLPAGTILALGPPVTLDELPGSYAAATRVLQAAQQTGTTGVVDLERLSWRMGVTASPETSAMLQERFLAPVREHGEFGTHVIEALTAYLQHGMSIPRAAAAIPVHVNTLRYRLRRFEDLTAADLSDLDDLFEIAWALAADAALGGH